MCDTLLTHRFRNCIFYFVKRSATAGPKRRSIKASSAIQGHLQHSVLQTKLRRWIFSSVSSRRYKPTGQHRHVSSLSRLLACKVVDVFIYRFFTGLWLRLRADISKVTAHERIQHLYYRNAEIF
jgi:hypothetical protein